MKADGVNTLTLTLSGEGEGKRGSSPRGRGAERKLSQREREGSPEGEQIALPDSRTHRSLGKFLQFQELFDGFAEDIGIGF